MEMKALIVEDNARMRQAIKSFIQDLVEEIHECADGNEALAHYHRHRPDWVLMDIKMQHMDGLAATRELKQAFPDAKVVIVTSHDESTLREEARQAGALGYVLKENLMELGKFLQVDPPTKEKDQ
jgi:CheY-like chemotaxis protein